MKQTVSTPMEQQAEFFQGGERVLYVDSEITLTEQRFVVRNRTYMLRQITSAKVRRSSNGYCSGQALGFLLVLGLIGWLYGQLAPKSAGTFIWVIAGACIALCWLSIAFHIIKLSYILTLQDASGEVQVLKSRNRSHIHRIKKILTDAMAGKK